MIPSFALEKLLPDNTRDYFRYNGSLTTPPCAPAVIWTVFKDVVYISDEQVRPMENTMVDKRLTHSLRWKCVVYGKPPTQIHIFKPILCASHLSTIAGKKHII